MQTYLLTAGDFSDYVVVALLQGPEGWDLKAEYARWREEVLGPLMRALEAAAGPEPNWKGIFYAPATPEQEKWFKDHEVWEGRQREYLLARGYDYAAKGAAGPGTDHMCSYRQVVWFAEDLVQCCGFVRVPFVEAVI